MVRLPFSQGKKLNRILFASVVAELHFMLRDNAHKGNTMRKVDLGK